MPSDWPTLLAHTRSLFPAPGEVRGRYAPSPTGPLHLGNLRTALIAWLQVRLQRGRFILRIEDLDRPRNVPGSAEAILTDLRWLGLDWDEGPECPGPVGPYTQSERAEIYAAALDELRSGGHLFPCYCSRKDIAEAASAPHGQSPVYPGTCRNLRSEQAERRRAARPDRHPALRFRVPDPALVTFDDLLAGPVRQSLPDEVGDFVVQRADRIVAYQLAVVVDDLLMGITDVVRGADLLHSTPRQIRLFEALGGLQPPRYWHVPLMLDDGGERLAKRNAAESLDALRAKGAAPQDVVGTLAASLGWVPRGSTLSATELLEEITLDDLRALPG